VADIGKKVFARFVPEALRSCADGAPAGTGTSRGEGRHVRIGSLIVVLLLVASVAHGQAPPGVMRGLDGAMMARVDGGGFQMGRDLLPGERADLMLEAPRHVVDVPTFFVDLTEVTNGQFARFVKEADYTTQAENDGTSSVWRGGEWVEVKGADWMHPEGPGSSLDRRMNVPVVHVSYNDALAYAKWCKKRLPTEAEWEKAARGTDARIWPWGNQPDPSRADCKERGIPSAMPVGSFPAGASPYGCLDMAGNVREWTLDYLNAYPGGAPQPELYGKRYRVVRGGAWPQSLADQRSYRREFRLPKHHESLTGFRCVWSETTVKAP